VISRGHSPFKHHLNDFIQVDFFDAEDAENKFFWPLDTLKLRFIEFTKDVFQDVE
jgi:hypothetical protein